MYSHLAAENAAPLVETSESSITSSYTSNTDGPERGHTNTITAPNNHNAGFIRNAGERTEHTRSEQLGYRHIANIQCFCLGIGHQ